MTVERWSRVQALYLEAEALPESARAEFLDGACGGDAALRAEVEALLSNTQETRGVFERTDPTLPGAPTDRPLTAGTRLGPWSIESLVGKGGMGEVYAAKRADGAFELKVAIKLLKRGLDSEAVVARFTKERRILAQLDHPNIAHVLDAGVAEDGRPFLAMEFVEGQPITEYVRVRRLPTAAILRLMTTVCEAVQAAHAKRIVHRDLKPSNVLVTSQGQVKLLDFGIAKALAEEDADSTRMAGEAMVLTPAYAAPEQLLGLPATPATDVYTLGVIVYQLLAERLPHQRAGRSTTEIAHGLDKETIERPSTVLRKERGRLPEPQRLERLKAVSRDLDLIVLKALHAEAGRRYPSAQELADDLQRLLDHRPIQARPDSAAYRLNRFVRRNRVAVSAAAAVILALTMGLAAALWQAHAALLARNDAVQRRLQADDLISFMLGDLKDHLDAAGRLDVLDSTVEKAMGYLGAHPGTTADPETLAQRTTALTEISEFQMKRGRLAEASASAREAVAEARLLRQQDHGWASGQLLGAALYALGEPLLDAGSFDAAGLLSKEALGVVSGDNAQSPGLELVRAQLEGQAAYILSRRPSPDFAGAERSAQRCIALLRGLAGTPAAAPKALVVRLHCEVQLGIVLFNAGERDGALQALGQFASDAQAIQAKNPNDMALLEFLQVGLAIAGEGFFNAGRLEQARSATQQAIVIGRRLVSVEPNNLDWRRNLLMAVLIDLDLNVRHRYWGPGREDSREAVALSQQALAQDPNSYLSRLLSMKVYSASAVLAAQSAGDRSGALGEVAKGLALIRLTDAGRDALEIEVRLREQQWLYALDRDSVLATAARNKVHELLERLKQSGDSQRLEFGLVETAYIDGRIDDGDKLSRSWLEKHNEDRSEVEEYRQVACAHRTRSGGLPCPSLPSSAP